MFIELIFSTLKRRFHKEKVRILSIKIRIQIYHKKSLIFQNETPVSF